MSSPTSPHDRLPSRVLAVLGEVELCLRGSTIYKMAWDVAFTADDREKLGGDVVKCREQHPNLIILYMNVRGVSQYRATIELADKLKVLSVDRDYMLREVGELVGKPDPLPAESDKGTLVWDKACLTLTMGREVIRKVKRPRIATNIIPILDAFQEEGWPSRIDDPLRGGADPTRLAAAVKSLNQGLRRIVFGKDGSGEGIVWRSR